MTTREYSDLVREQGIEKYFVFPKIQELKEDFTIWYFNQPFICEERNSLDIQNPDFLKYRCSLDKNGGSCYLNAQRVLKLDNERRYIYNEGFYSTTYNQGERELPFYVKKELVMHAFNTIERKVMDFESTLKPSVICSNYYGISIPNEVVDRLLKMRLGEADILGIRSAISLVVPYFLISTGREHLLRPDSYYFCPADCVNS